jgi:hypothetical protein
VKQWGVSMKSKGYVFFVMFLSFSICTHSGKAEQSEKKRGGAHEEQAAESTNPLDLIEKINEKNIIRISKSLWSTPQLVHIFKDTQNALEAYEKCAENSHSKQWLEWRYSRKKCEGELSVDGFRRAVIQQHFTEAVNRALQALERSSVAWNAIGTQGPGSDIDIVAYAKEGGHEGVKITEITAKVLFDTLCIALYGKTSGETFDTESYIDVTKDLGEKYKKLIKDKDYQNLAFTLSQVQVFRQLEHPIVFQDAPIFSWKNYMGLWKNTPFLTIVSDAQRFNEYGKPLDGALKNLGHSLPLVYRLSQAFYEVETPLKKAIVAGIQGTYFPEGYFTNESLKHVCYSDDRYSQLLLRLIQKKLETKDSLTPEDIDALIQNESLEGITPFVYAVSAGENIGYFLHKINDAQDVFGALVNASKYLFRVARALCSYMQIDTDAPPRSWKNSAQEYAYRLFEVSSKFERLKRGVVPFTTQKDIQNILYGALKSFKVSTPSLEALSHAIYNLFMKQWAKSSVKKEAMSDLGVDIHRFGIFWNDESGAYEADDINDAKKREAAQKLLALLNLAIGSENKISEEQKNKETEALQKSALLPLWQKDGQIKYKKISQASVKDFRDFFVGLILFYRDVIIEDYAKTSRHTFNPLNLRDETEEILQEF